MTQQEKETALRDLRIFVIIARTALAQAAALSVKITLATLGVGK